MSVLTVPAPSTALENISEIAAEVVRKEANALLQLSESMPPGVADAVHLIREARGRVIVSGMGKSGHVGRKIAATLASTGTPAQFVHPAEASHGDLGMITSQDVCLLLSNSGETAELADLVAYAKRFAIPMIGMTRNPASSLAQQCDVVLDVPDVPEACTVGMAPTTSTTLMMALGDAMAVALMRLRGFEREHFAAFHPGGKLGSQLLKVSALMHTGDEMPIVSPETPMGETLVTMTAKGLGLAAVISERVLIGVITDGDLRRNLSQLMQRTAGEVCTRNPRTIHEDQLASEALGIMNGSRITSLCVVGAQSEIVGILHIHDCLRAGIV